MKYGYYNLYVFDKKTKQQVAVISGNDATRLKTYAKDDFPRKDYIYEVEKLERKP